MKVANIRTFEQALNFVEGCINDFEAGISTKEETLNLMGEYTARLMELFWEQSKKRIIGDDVLSAEIAWQAMEEYAAQFKPNPESMKRLEEANFKDGYKAGHNDAVKEAREEIRKNYQPNR